MESRVSCPHLRSSFFNWFTCYITHARNVLCTDKLNYTNVVKLMEIIAPYCMLTPHPLTGTKITQGGGEGYPNPKDVQQLVNRPPFPTSMP